MNIAILYVDTKTRLIYMLPTKDSLHIQRYTQIESEGISKLYFMKMEIKRKLEGIPWWSSG